MKYIGYILILLFWGGVLLITNNMTLGKRMKGRLRRNSAGKSTDSMLREKLSDIKKSIRKQSLLQELSEGLAYTKNLAVLGRERSVSSIVLLEELASFCPKLSPAFVTMAQKLAVNEKQQAAEVLFSSIGEPCAKDIGKLLSEWEDLSPDELLGSIDAFSKSLRAERITYLKRKDELISDLIYFPVVLNCMLVLLNFIIVAYFIDQKASLFLLFGK